jgi:hypothetical protein
MPDDTIPQCSLTRADLPSFDHGPLHRQQVWQARCLRQHRLQCRLSFSALPSAGRLSGSGAPRPDGPYEALDWLLGRQQVRSHRQNALNAALSPDHEADALGMGQSAAGGPTSGPLTRAPAGPVGLDEAAGRAGMTPGHHTARGYR